MCIKWAHLSMVSPRVLIDALIVLNLDGIKVNVIGFDHAKKVYVNCRAVSVICQHLNNDSLVFIKKL